MTLPFTSNPLMYVQSALWLCATVVYLRQRHRVRLPVFGFFLGFKAASAMALLAMQRTPLAASGSGEYLPQQLASYIYWISYFTGCILLFFALQQLFRRMTAALPGLSKLGTICFRWAALVSLVIAFAFTVTASPRMAQNLSHSFVLVQIATCLCVLEMCLLAFLLACLYSLKHTLHSRVFGLCLGLGILTAMDTVTFARPSSSLLHELSAFATMSALMIVLAYLIRPEPAGNPAAALPMNSPLLHWNDLALALGHNEEPATGQNGFLQDVEGVVDRVLAKNSMSSVG